MHQSSQTRSKPPQHVFKYDCACSTMHKSRKKIIEEDIIRQSLPLSVISIHNGTCALPSVRHAHPD